MTAWVRGGMGPTRWLLHLVALLLLASLPLSNPAGAHAEQELIDDQQQVDDQEIYEPVPIDQLVELPGSCPMAAPIEPGNAIDCWFTILPGMEVESLPFAQLGFEDQWWSCRVESPPAGSDELSRLECPELLGGFFQDGSLELDLRVDGFVAPAAATATFEWAPNADFSLFAEGLGEHVVFDGRPLRVTTFVYEPVERLFASVRRRDGVEILDIFEIELGPTFDTVETEALPDLPPGRYRFWPCVGATPSTCEEQPGGEAFQVINGEIFELIPGHNRASADRINVLFISSGLERMANGDRSHMLPDLAEQMLTLDGPLGDDYDGVFRPESETVTRLVWGPMAIEPLASHVDRFNFWYLPEEVADEESMLSSGFDRLGDLGFDLPNLHITALYNNVGRSVSDARGTSFETVEPDEVPPIGRVRFGDARVWVTEFDPVGSATTLAHEWGHGLFGLRDEYYGFDDRPIVVGYPNCAPDEATAMEWWGDLVGTTDPFAEHVQAVSAERLGPWELDALGDVVARTTIEISAGGCYSDFDSDEVYRPSVDSLMNSEVPVFGAVNRERVQEVLDQFSGRGPMDSLDDLTIECEGLVDSIECRGELRTHLDRPLSIVAINSIPCEFGGARTSVLGDVLPVAVTCNSFGSPADPVRLSFKSESRWIDVVDLKPFPAAGPVERVAIDQEVIEEEDADPRTGRTVATGVLLCVAAISLGFVERRRRSRDASTQ